MRLEDSIIAVTGASGFLGRNIVEVLLARGARVIAVIRDPDRSPHLHECRVELRRADLACPGDLVRGLDGADALVSNAALLNFGWQDWQQHLETNVKGAINVLEAAAVVGIKRVVHLSSISVYAEPKRRRLDEDQPLYDLEKPRSFSQVYPLSKALGEREIWRLAARLGLQLTTLRPSGIFGAWDDKFWRLVKWLFSPPVMIVPAGLRIGWVYAGDVAEAVALSLERPLSAGRAYNLCDGDRSFWQLLNAWQKAGGRAPIVKIPLPVPVKRDYDNGRAKRELGWKPTPLVAAMRQLRELESRWPR
ncbi:MAG: NAD-dependent epimerase/dehydratase family protein [Candidatus Binatia bacterium]